MINWIKNKTKINLVIDAVMFILLMAMTGLGFLIKYVLVPGYQRNSIYDSDLELYFLGLTRHEWGRIHLWSGFCFLLLLILHILLHWKMIGSIFRQIVSIRVLRLTITVLIGVTGIFLAVAPLFMKPDVSPFPRKYLHSRVSERFIDGSNEPAGTDQEKSDEKILTIPAIHENQKRLIHEHDEIELYGYMNLIDVSAKYNIPVEELAGELNIPLTYNRYRLGWLRRRHGFKMVDVKDAVIKLKK